MKTEEINYLCRFCHIKCEAYIAKNKNDLCKLCSPEILTRDVVNNIIKEIDFMILDLTKDNEFESSNSR